MAVPVRRLRIVHPDFPNPIDIALPWDSYSGSLQDGLDALDANDDGTITYAPQLGGPPTSNPSEVQHGNETADRLNRILWGNVWLSPSNNRLNDQGTIDDRWRQVQTLQNAVFDNVVDPLLGKGTDLAKWGQARRILAEGGDFIHLYRLALRARARWVDTQNADYLRAAEGLLLDARRYAAPVRAGRLQYAKKIESELNEVNPLLDQEDRKRFQEDTKAPFLMAAVGSPVTADLATMKPEGGTVTFGVAVPKSFLKEHEKDLDAAVLNYFNKDSSVAIRASAFQDTAGASEFKMTAASVEKDAPGPNDDPIDAQSSFHLYQPRLQRTIFRGGEEMAYVRVKFTLPNAEEALDKRPVRRFDLLLKKGDKTRTIDGGFVLQDMAGQTSHDVFASDLHVAERDYEVVRVMADSLRSLANRYETDGIEPDKIPILRSQAEEVERFYQSVNEQVEAAVSLWNESYRKGEIHRVFLAGDLADFTNIAITLERQGYRGSNIRRLREILGKIEAPLYVVSGNHDYHAYPFPLSLHLRNLVHNESLRDLYAAHYDNHRFPNAVLYAEGVKALLTRSSKADGWIGQVLEELYAKEPFQYRNDDFLDHHLREIGTYETYGVGLGNGFRVFAWPTETEHFNYSRYLLEEVHEPVGPHVIGAMTQYIGQQNVNGKGPRPENFISFLREMEAAKQSGQKMILMGHYPAFHGDEGPDQSVSSADSLRGDAAWAVRMASWYYRRDDGESVLALAVAGHVHQYGEFDFSLKFDTTEERKKFRAELGKILEKKDPDTIFTRLHNLRHKWDLDHRMELRSVQTLGSDGFPGPILKDFNAGSKSYCKRRGTAFVTAGTLGIPDGDGSGYLVVTSRPTGEIDLSMRVLRVGPQAGIVSEDGRKIEDFRKKWWDEDRAWDKTRAMTAFQAHANPTALKVSAAGTPEQAPRLDWFPLVCQYPHNKMCINLDLGFTWDWRSGDKGVLAGGLLLFPLSHDVHPLFGGPNMLAVGAEYSSVTRGLNTRVGLDWGAIRTYAIANNVTTKNPFLGGEVGFKGLLPAIPPEIGVWGGSTLDGNWGVGLNLRLDVPSLSIRLPGHHHPER